MGNRILFILFSLAALLACSEDPPPNPDPDRLTFFLGGDLSYVNEMDDCGGVYRVEGLEVDAYELFATKGANIVRLRLWHTPQWTDYSDLTDVKRSIGRAKANSMQVLLDFHYSDDWADPGSQEIPAAWSSATTKEELGQLLYDYTYNTLAELEGEGLSPDIVQLGNEVNPGLLHWPDRQPSDPIDWESTVYYLNKGIQAVNKVNFDLGLEIETMIHIAQPENVGWWFTQAFASGLTFFDWIGFSYYPKWSSVSIFDIGDAIAEMKKNYNREIMIVETAYPHTLENFDAANNNLGQEALIPQYPASPNGQRSFLFELVKQVREGEGLGVIYWEPAWISTGCSTRWATGSHWDNATFFDAFNNNEALPAFDFLKE